MSSYWSGVACNPVSWVRAESLQSCLTLCSPMDCSPLGSVVHGIHQERNPAVGCPPLRGLPAPGIKLASLKSHLLHWQAGSLQLAPPGKPQSSIPGVFIERGQLDADTQGEGPVIEVCCHKSGNYQKPGESPGADPSLGPSRGHGSVHPVNLDL